MQEKRIGDFPILSEDEITKRLKAMKINRRGYRKEGEGISILAIARFLKMNYRSLYNATRGLVTKPIQIKLSELFARYDAGELSFYYSPLRGWHPVYHNPPRPMPLKAASMRIALQGGQSKLSIGP